MSEQLLKRLVGMTRRKLACQARKHHRQRRDSRRAATDGQEQLAAVAAAGPGPSQLAAGRELLQQVRERLSKEERRLADLRGQGYDWAEIAAQVGETFSRPGHQGSITGAAYAVAFSPDGRYMASGSESSSSERHSSIIISDVTSGQELFRLPGDEGLATFSPDGLLLASGSSRGFLRIWD